MLKNIHSKDRAMRHRLAVSVKRLLFGYSGERYRIGDHTLRFLPGTRPVRRRYTSSTNVVNRYDALQMEWLVRHLCPGDTAIDVGANVGGDSVVMAALCGQSGNVVAFEPDETSRAMIVRNFALNPSIKKAKIECFACLDREGLGVLHRSHVGDANASLVDYTRDAAIQTSVEVTTLDAYISRSELPVPKVVKIDTEGAEIRILKGATGLLSSQTSILCEFHPYAWSAFGNSFDELIALVGSFGRQMRYLDETTDVTAPHYGIAVF